MKKLHIWVFYISIFFGTMPLSGQNEVNSVATDSLEIIKTPLSLRLGIDLYRIALSQISDDFSGYEAVGDVRIGKDLFVAMEIGSLETKKQVEQVNFTSSGNYLKLGFDYNMFENMEGMNNHITLGLRLASSKHKHYLNSYTILDRTRFWPSSDLPINNGYATGERLNLSAFWFEVVVSFKVQILKNVYTGVSLRLNRLLNDKLPENFDNIYIPGFNKKTEDNVFGGGFNYTLTYNIPFLTKKNN